MTQRLYYNDPHLLEFDGRVVRTFPVGDHHGVILDRTAFYPTAGGQPNDLGTLNGVPVLDCFENEETEEVVHVVQRPIAEPVVHGLIDRDRRLDHMQQHSGQHVLSQAFVELFGWTTVGFHLGATASTIDLSVESLTRDDAVRAEGLANRIVLEDRPVAVRYVPAEKVSDFGIRKPTERAGDIRVIDIEGFDRSACGGTHVQRTGEIGPILITRIERMKKQARVEFVCGLRAIRYAREATRVLEAIGQIVSAAPAESLAGVRSMAEELLRGRKRIDELEEKLMDYEAAEFPVTDGIAVTTFKGRSIDHMKMLAQKICARKSAVVLFADESDQVRLVFARSAELDIDVSAILKKTLERFGGRGGGRPNLAQGGGALAEGAGAVLEFAKKEVRRALR